MGKLFFCVSVFLLLSLSPAMGQSVHLLGKYNGINGTAQWVKITGFYNGGWNVMDSVKLSDTGSINKTIVTKNAVFYRIRLGNYPALEVLLTDKDTSFQYQTTKDYIGKGVYDISPTAENAVYAQLNTLVDKQQKEIALLNKERENLSSLDSFFVTKKARLEDLLHKKQLGFNLLLNDFSAKYPKTFTGDIITRFYTLPVRTDNKSYDNDDAFYHDHFWDYLNFKDDRTVKYPTINDKVGEYFRKYVSPETESNKKAFDKILDASGLSKNTQEAIINYLLTKLTSMHNFELGKYLLNKYPVANNTTAAGPFRVAAGMSERLRPGLKAPDIVLKGKNENFIPLLETSKKAPYTLLVFWATDCGICEKTTGELNTLLKDNKGKLQIYGVSLDTDKNTWINAVNTTHSGWVNVCDFIGLDSPACTLYDVSFTPTIYIVDKAGILQSGKLTADELPARLNTLLGR